MTKMSQERGIFSRLLSWTVRSPWTYRVLLPLIEAANLKEQTYAFKIWVRYLLWMMRQGCSRKRKVIWMSAFTPVELAYAMDAVPILPEIVAALVSYLGRAPTFLALGDSHLSTDVCSFYRCALGLVLEDLLPPPDVIVSCSYLCDGANKFFSYLSKKYGCPHLLLDPAYGNGQGAVAYVRGQLHHLLEDMGSVLGQRVNLERLREVVRLSNKARTNAERVNKARMARPAPFPGSEGLSYVAGMGFCSPGSAWGVRFFESLAVDLNNRTKVKHGYLPQERHRILWLHHIRPYYRNDIFEFLSSRGVAVCFEEANYLYYPPLDPDNPLDSLVKKVLSNVWRGPLERRIQAVLAMVRDYKADAVIHFSHWGCRQSCGGAAVIGEVLKQRGIPYMVLYGDGADPDNNFPGQTRTRLQAFAEMLG